MAIDTFLAMTAAELQNSSNFPSQIAWMACHFSPYSTGLSNLPTELPPGSVLMVNDITPIRGHDPEIICDQLAWCVQTLECCGVLLDFQRPDCKETKRLVHHLSQALPCPVVVSEFYAGELTCPVFLPPVPPSVPQKEYFAPWQGREIWLEIGLDGESITLNEQGSQTTLLPCPDISVPGFSDEMLHCHYTIQTDEKSARFTLWRTKEDLEQILTEAESLGVVGTVGLFQELHRFAAHQSLPLEGKVARRSRDG